MVAIAAGLAATVILVAFVVQVQKKQPSYYTELGSPSSAYFLAGAWLALGRFATALLTFGPARRGDLSPWTRQIALLLSVLFYILLLSWLAAILSLVLGKL